MSYLLSVAEVRTTSETNIVRAGVAIPRRKRSTIANSRIGNLLRGGRVVGGVREEAAKIIGARIPRKACRKNMPRFRDV